MFYVGINLFVHCGSSKYLYALPAPLKLNRPIQKVFPWDEEKPKKSFVLVQKMRQQGCALSVRLLVKFSFLAHLEKREQSVRNVVKNLNCSPKS